MKKHNAAFSRTPADLEAAVKAAETKLERPPEGKSKKQQIALGKITLMPELFQPRRLLKNTNTQHVKKLEKYSAVRGQLGEILVVKIGGKWICVDGHHRLEAYKRRKYTAPDKIDCLWFAGSVRQAVDESVLRNTEAKLDLNRNDKLEAAWQRIALGWDESKSRTSAITGVSQRTVASMRAAAEAFKRNDEYGRKLRTALGERLKEVTWSNMRNTLHNIAPTEREARDTGAKWARRLRTHFQDRLSQDPAATAWMLAHYDEELPGLLQTEMGAVIRAIRGEEDDAPDTRTEPSAMDTDALQRQRWAFRGRLATIEKLQIETQARLASVEAELNARANGGDPFGPEQSASDEVWLEWVRAGLERIE